MGDSRRFYLMAELIAAQFPNYKDREIADVAGGKGYLKSELHRLQYRRVKVIDRRHRLAKARPGREYAYFDYRSRDRYALVVGMHPDEATDHIILYAVKNTVPFVVCPCCIKPSATLYQGKLTQKNWIEHLAHLSQDSHTISRFTLRMTGKNEVLIGRPK